MTVSKILNDIAVSPYIPVLPLLAPAFSLIKGPRQCRASLSWPLGLFYLLKSIETFVVPDFVVRVSEISTSNHLSDNGRVWQGTGFAGYMISNTFMLRRHWSDLTAKRDHGRDKLGQFSLVGLTRKATVTSMD